MDDVVDLIATNAAASEVSDRIKDHLYAKSAEKLDAIKPSVANSFFGGQAPENAIVADAEEAEEAEEPTEQEQEE